MINILPYTVDIAKNYVAEAYKEASIDAVFDDGGNVAFKDELSFLKNLNTGGVGAHVLQNGFFSCVQINRNRNATTIIKSFRLS